MRPGVGSISRWGPGAAQGRETVLPLPWEGHLSIFNHDMFRATAVAEMSGELGKSLVKFCSGDVGPDGVLPDTQLLDPLLKETSTAPLAQPPGKGMDGECRWDPLARAYPVPSSHPAASGPQHPCLSQIDSSTSTRRGPRGCPRLPSSCTAGEGPVGVACHPPPPYLRPSSC